ncbi:MAG: COG3650 family protein, partial [Longimicrobiales bacterium]
MHGTRTRATLLFMMIGLAACAGTDAPGAGGDVGADPVPNDTDPFESFEGSAAVWEGARERGVRFRAVGQEPGWLIEVTPQQQIHVLADYGEITFDAPWSEPVRDDDGTLTYLTSTAAHTVRIVVREIPCSDTMSGEEFPLAVVLELDERALYGCGRMLD